MPAYKRTYNRAPNAPMKRRKFTPQRKAKPVVRGESHYFDTQSLATSMSTTGDVHYCMLNLAEGTSNTDRIGKKIALKGLQLRGQFIANSATTDAYGIVYVVYDRDGPPSTGVPFGDVISSTYFLNDSNKDRFKVLKTIPVSMTKGSSSENQLVECYIDLTGLQCRFKALGTGAIGDMNSGQIYIVSRGDQAAGTSDIQYDIRARLRFYDV